MQRVMRLKNEENFQKKCRLCGRLGRRFTDIFTPQLPSAETKSNKKLSQLIYKCLQLQVKEDDSLPKKICDDCNKKLASWQNFYRKCEQTQKRLQQYLENWQKLSVSVLSSNEHSVTYSDGVGSDSYRAVSQISLGDKIPTETTRVKPLVLPKKVKDVLSLNSSTQDNLRVGRESLNDEHKHNKNTVKGKNAKEGKIDGKVKLKKHGIQKKNSCQGGTDNNGEQGHGVEISNENGQSQKHFTEGTTDCVKSICLSNSSSKTKKSVEVHQCHICNKTFPSHRKLNVHIAIHLSQPEFQCDKCSKKFRSKFSLRSHLETHSATRNYCCHLCGRLFHTASGLCNHVKLHSEETKRFTCPLCGKQFRQAGHLEQHQRTHTGERPHRCTECMQRFTTRCQLSRHIQGVHLGAKKHKCLVCGKEFLYSPNFKAHLLRHAGQRNNKCGECGKTFVTSNALFRHRRFHTGDKPFQCDICGKKFADCSNRKRHMVRHLQQPVIPRGRKSGPQPKLTRIINLKKAMYARQEQLPSGKQVQQPSDGQEDAKVDNKLVQFSVSPSMGGSQAEGNRSTNSSQSTHISGQVVKLCCNNNMELSNLTTLGMSQLPPQLNVISKNSQHPSYNNFITDNSNIYVSLSPDLPQFIQLSSRNPNLLIQPLARDITQGVHGGMERQCVDKLDSSVKDKFSHYDHTLIHATKVNGSALCALNVPDEDPVHKNGNFVIDNADKAKLYQTEEDSRDTEIDRPKTYTNLRTFLESSEVVETISGGKNDVVDSDSGLVNVEYVTLMANDGNEASFTSGIQEIIVLPHESKISDYDLSKNVGKFRMVLEGNETSTDRKSACCAQQVVKENMKSLTVSTEAAQSSQLLNDGSHLSHAVDKEKMTEYTVQAPSTKRDNVIEIFLSSSDGNKLPRNTEGISNKTHNETVDSSNLIQVLLESDGNNTTPQQDGTDKNQQTFLVSSGVFSDEDAIIRMLNSQGTVMLSTTRTEFQLTESPVADATHLIEGSSEAVGMAVNKYKTGCILDFKSFSSVGDAVISETASKKGESNVAVPLMSSDYSHEISLTTAVTVDDTDVSLVVRKRMSEEEQFEAGGLQASDQNEVPSVSVDDIEILELCSADLTKLAPIYQVYQTGKTLDNV